jgi:uncharacterized protein YlzI (FlbEa/FlbD family)
MNWIKVKGEHGQDVYVNLENVHTIQFVPHKCKTLISFSESDCLLTTTPYNEIINKIAK